MKRQKPTFLHKQWWGDNLFLIFEIAMIYLLFTWMGSLWGLFILHNKNFAYEKVKKLAWKKHKLWARYYLFYMLVVHILILHNDVETKEQFALIVSILS